MGFCLVGFCLVGFCPVGFCPVGFCPDTVIICDINTIGLVSVGLMQSM